MTFIRRKEEREECSKADQLAHFVYLVFSITSKVFSLAISIFYTLLSFKETKIYQFEVWKTKHDLEK